MRERIKRRKEDGFTLIELMIVIAVIGILAIVLVPKVGSIKTQAKSAGIDTNLRTVQAYCESRINSWVSAGTSAAVVAADIDAAFSANKLANPITATTADPVIDVKTASPADNALFISTSGDGEDNTTNDANAKGTIVVAPSETSSKLTQIKIYAHDPNGRTMSDKTVTVNP